MKLYDQSKNEFTTTKPNHNLEFRDYKILVSIYNKQQRRGVEISITSYCNNVKQKPGF